MSELSIIRPGAKRMGFFTDTTVCIGCKACEVACKQWNDLPGFTLNCQTSSRPRGMSCSTPLTRAGRLIVARSMWPLKTWYDRRSTQERRSPTSPSGIAGR